jgi:LIVCS family branched-chain amino acid:cation transporter
MGSAVIVGFALFSMLFGAGNIIFPPYIGVISGDSWPLAFGAYFFADIGLAVLAFLAMLASDTISRFESIFLRMGHLPSRILTGGVILSVCCIASPRTATVSYELGMIPAFGDFGLPIYTGLYFAAVWLFGIKESKMIDYIGKYLTPLLVISLVIMIIIAFFNPVGEMSTTPKIDNLWFMGLISGYQTMDAATGCIFGYVIARDLANKGFKDNQSQISAVVRASFIMAALMFIVYGGLCYIGATASMQYGADVQHGPLVVALFQTILGTTAGIALGIIVTLACLTTGIGLTSAAATFIVNVSGGKIKYNVVFTALCVFYAFVANLGLAQILAIAVPVILIIFPALVTMTMLSFFNKQITNDNVFRFAVYFALAFAVMEVLHNMYGVTALSFVTKSPLFAEGFGWILPAVIGGCIGMVVKAKKTA